MNFVQPCSSRDKHASNAFKVVLWEVTEQLTRYLLSTLGIPNLCFCKMHKMNNWWTKLFEKWKADQIVKEALCLA